MSAQLSLKFGHQSENILPSILLLLLLLNSPPRRHPAIPVDFRLFKLCDRLIQLLLHLIERLRLSLQLLLHPLDLLLPSGKLLGLVDAFRSLDAKLLRRVLESLGYVCDLLAQSVRGRVGDFQLIRGALFALFGILEPS